MKTSNLIARVLRFNGPMLTFSMVILFIFSLFTEPLLVQITYGSISIICIPLNIQEIKTQKLRSQNTNIAGIIIFLGIGVMNILIPLHLGQPAHLNLFNQALLFIGFVFIVMNLVLLVLWVISNFYPRSKVR